MTNDTSYRQKGRAVFLAAIMVLSMVAGAAVLTGSVAANHGGDGDTEIGSGDNPRVYQGQELEITDLNDSETYAIVDSDDTTVGEFSANGSHAVVSSDGLSEGQYEVQDSDGANVSRFRVATQDFSASFDPTSASESSTVTLDSTNRAGPFDVNVSSDDIDDIGDVFDVNEDDQIENVTGGLNDETTVDADGLSDLDTGNYTVDFDVADTTASATANITVTEEDVSAEFTQGTYTEEAGDDVEFGFETSDLDTVYVEVVDEHDAYNVTFEVSDFEDDSASLEMNTFEAGNSSVEDVFSAEDADISVERNESNLQGDRLQPSRVDVRLYQNEPGTDNANQLDRSIVRLQEGSLDSATTWVAPGDTDEEQSSLLDAATEQTDVAGGDYVVTEIQGSGYHSYLTEGDNFTAGDQDVSITVQDTEEAVYGSSDGVTVTNDSVELLHDAENDTVYALITPSDIDALEDGETWETEFAIGEDNPYVDENTSVNSSFSFSERSIEFDFEENDNGQIQVPGGNGSEISGTSTAAPGTEIAVSAYFDTEILDATAEVGEDGSWSTTLDLGEYESGNQFGLQATESASTAGDADNADTGELDAVITEGNGSVPASFSVDASLSSDTVTVGESATLEYTISNTGDEAGETNYTVTVDGEEVNSSTAELESGGSTDTMTYEDFDTSSAGDVSWEVASGDETASGTLTVEEENGTDTGTDTGTGNGTDGDSDDGDSDGGQPGFGLVVALFALIGAALLALRRQN